MASARTEPKAQATAASKKGSPATAKSKGKAGSEKKKADEYESVLSGRLITALALALAMVLIPVSGIGHLFAKESPKSAEREAWKVGQVATIHLTVTTADYEKLGCLDARPAGDAHCEFQDERTPFPAAADAPTDDNRKHVLQPYRTTDGQLLLVPGLWAQPEVAMRLHKEPSRGVSEKRLARFIASCEVEFIEERKGAQIRWSRTERWSDQGPAMIAIPRSCTILDKARP